MSAVVLAKSRMQMNAEEPLFEELARTYPTIPTHIVFAVMYQFSSDREQCHEALRRAAPNYVEPPPTQIQWHQEGGRGDEAGAQAIRPRSDSAGSLSGSSSCSDNTAASKHNTGHQSRTNFNASDNRRYVEHYNQGQGYSPHINETSAQMRNITIDEERGDCSTPELTHGGWTGSPHPSRKPHPSYQVHHHINCPSHAHRPPFEGAWMPNQGSGNVARPRTFEQSFSDRNGDLRDSPNTPSPVSHHVSSYHAIPPTPPVSSGFYSPPPMHEHQSDRQAGAYSHQQAQQGAVGGYPTPQNSYRPPVTSPINHKSAIYIPMHRPQDPTSQQFRAQSPSQPPPKDSFSRNVPQSLPIYRPSFHHQASSDSSPGTPGQKATTPGMYNHTSCSGQFIQTPPGQGASNQFGHASTGLATTPGQFNPVFSGSYMSPQHYGNPSHSSTYGLPGPPQYHHMPPPHTYVNTTPPRPTPHYQSPSGHHQHHPNLFPGDWSMQPQDPRAVDPRRAWPEYNPEAEMRHGEEVHFRQSPPESHMSGSTRRQLSATTPEHPSFRKSSLGEDSAYITTLMEHQRKRRISLQEELQCSLQLLSMLRQEVSACEKDLIDRRKSRTHFTATAEDVQRKKQENKKLQVDIHLLTMRIDAATPDSSTLRLGVLDNLPPPRDPFYSSFPSGQSVRPRDHHSQSREQHAMSMVQQPVPMDQFRDQRSLPTEPQALRRVPPPRPPLPAPLRTPQSLPPERELETEQWQCSACTFKNHPALDKCEICEMPRMSPGSKGFG